MFIRTANDCRALSVGYILHSLLLVPYFSWQRSHAVHHSRTNHVMEGETHVPARINTPVRPASCWCPQ
jgi:fatty acid desaturase